MRNMFIALSLLVALIVAGGCSNESSSTTVATTGTQPSAGQQADLTPEELGELGAKIAKNPDDANRLLSEKGLTEESFEQAIRKVSEDPSASQRYAEAYRRANNSA